MGEISRIKQDYATMPTVQQCNYCGIRFSPMCKWVHPNHGIIYVCEPWIYELSEGVYQGCELKARNEGYEIMSGWIGVDLDGTLAEYGGMANKDSIGPPVPRMVERVKQWIREGKTVKIFTARACIPEHIPVIRAWLERHGMGGLEITNVKDFSCIEIWDDRAVHVRMNTGEIIG